MDFLLEWAKESNECIKIVTQMLQTTSTTIKKDLPEKKIRDGMSKRKKNVKKVQTDNKTKKRHSILN